MRPVYKKRVQEVLREAGYQESDDQTPAVQKQEPGWQVWAGWPHKVTQVTFFGDDILQSRNAIIETLRSHGWIVEEVTYNIHHAITVSHPGT